MKGATQPVKLRDLLTSVDRSEAVSPDKEYRLLGIRLAGRGPFIRETVYGDQSAASSLNRVQHGDFIYSRLFAWQGAFGLVAPELDGCYVSNEFPVFRPTDDRLSLPYLTHWFRLPSVLKRVERDCTGSTPGTRNRYKEKFFLDLEIPLPSRDDQAAVAELVAGVQERITQRRAVAAEVANELEALLGATFKKLIADAPRRPLSAVAPIVRRQVEVDPDGTYPEIGIRSFGRGTFHKPALSGVEVGSKRLFSVQAGDLVLMNVFAWEGAIAVAQKVDAGRVGSHRFITCVADPAVATAEFVRFYLLTREGLDEIGKASPGGAGRNRTLGVEALMKIAVPVPPLEKQRWFDRLQETVGEARRLQDEIETELGALFPAAINRVYQSPS